LTRRKFGGWLLLLLAPNGGRTKAVETLARPRPFAESAGILQQTFKVRGANPRFPGFASSKFAANQQHRSSIPSGQPARVAGTAFGDARETGKISVK